MSVYASHSGIFTAVCFVEDQSEASSLQLELHRASLGALGVCVPSLAPPYVGPVPSAEPPTQTLPSTA